MGRWRLRCWKRRFKCKTGTAWGDRHGAGAGGQAGRCCRVMVHGCARKSRPPHPAVKTLLPLSGDKVRRSWGEGEERDMGYDYWKDRFLRHKTNVLYQRKRGVVSVLLATFYSRPGGRRPRPAPCVRRRKRLQKRPI